jgi:hypothetical protein
MGLRAAPGCRCHVGLGQGLGAPRLRSASRAAPGERTSARVRLPAVPGPSVSPEHARVWEQRSVRRAAQWVAIRSNG